MDQLTRDAVDARKAGMHYGDFIAKRRDAILEELEAERRRKEAAAELDNPSKKCLCCGVQLIGRRHKYCSTACQVAYYDLHRRK